MNVYCIWFLPTYCVKLISYKKAKDGKKYLYNKISMLNLEEFMKK